MKINKNENRVKIDVDQTLITNFSSNKIERVMYSGTGDKLSLNTYPANELTLNYYGNEVYANPIVKHIDLLKAFKSRGYEIEVWSANGWQWAEEVVTKLGLTEYVDEVGTKPSKYIDDKDANAWMHRVFID